MSKKELEHIPLPDNCHVRSWSAESFPGLPYAIVAPLDRGVMFVACADNQTYAADITKRINAHEELVASCKAFKQYLWSMQLSHSPEYKNVCLALQKAGVA